MTYETLTLTIEGPVATVTMNRPDKMNAMNAAYFGEMQAVFAAIDDNPSIRAVILNANGKHFTAGLDLMDTANVMGDTSGDPARARDRLRRRIHWLQDAMSVVERCRVPVIAAVHGACIGGGIDLIAAADIRIATTDSWFAIKEVDVGIVADLGTLQRARHVLSDGLVRELALTGRRVEAAEALSRGLVTHLHESRDALMAAAQEMAALIASKSPLAVVGTKAVMNHARNHTIEDGLEYVATWNAGMLIGEDLMKAAAASMTKQPADFKDLLAG
ncbi:crotonase/enoyl-CoA hydratase family protein [Gimibacter soli]|uniref:Crotonase/enoyl-CoA hydratase family protein n=1 Tax=Gimibacter soli TaxID=3024400 RepID=A0AAF0BMQ5_9PROT|nr:crotonase/enoyl-CoA hydratase family protein [Gimibacter soli]WCL54885.1 crotonase/enoyl-CoA hydratase family protein [Gimibacter soli]